MKKKKNNNKNNNDNVNTNEKNEEVEKIIATRIPLFNLNSATRIVH